MDIPIFLAMITAPQIMVCNMDTTTATLARNMSIHTTPIMITRISPLIMTTVTFTATITFIPIFPQVPTTCR